MNDGPFKPNPIAGYPQPGSVAAQLKRLSTIFLWAMAGFFCFIGLWIVWEFILVLGSDDVKKSEAIRNVGLIFLAVVGAPFVVWRAFIADRQSRAAAKSSEAAYAQIERSTQRDSADLFTEAVKMLGATIEKRSASEDYKYEANMPVRLGAIYALDRVSKDSRRDYLAVMKTFTAYIRENSNKFSRCPDFDLMEKRPTDIIAISKIISARTKDQVIFERENDYKLDLSESELQYLNFDAADLRNANFWKSYLDRAYLRGADFSDADMERVSMRGANLRGANLETCRFLAQQTIDATFGDITTKLPSDLNIPSHWSRNEISVDHWDDDEFRQWLANGDFSEPN